MTEEPVKPGARGKTHGSRLLDYFIERKVWQETSAGRDEQEVRKEIDEELQSTFGIVPMALLDVRERVKKLDIEGEHHDALSRILGIDEEEFNELKDAFKLSHLPNAVSRPRPAVPQPKSVPGRGMPRGRVPHRTVQASPVLPAKLTRSPVQPPYGARFLQSIIGFAANLVGKTEEEIVADLAEALGGREKMTAVKSALRTGELEIPDDCIPLVAAALGVTEEDAILIQRTLSEKAIEPPGYGRN